MRVAADNAKQTLKSFLPGKYIYALIALLVCVGSSTAAFASLSFSATKESFPKQVVGTLSAGKVVTVTTTVSPQSVVITVSGDYQESDNCFPQFSTSCAVTVKFAPTVASGTVEGAVTFTDNSGNVLGVISLTGIATGQVTATPTSESFGPVAIGTTTASKTVKVINNTTFAVTNVTLTVSGDFAIVPGSNCPAGLGSKASCTFSVTATPNQLGTIKGAVIVTNTVNGSGLAPR